MGEFPASKVNLQLATWLTGTFHSRRMSTEYWPVWGVVIGPHWDLQYRAGGGGGGVGLGGVEYQNGKWVWPKGEIHPFSRGGGEGFRTNNPQLFSTSNPRRHPELSFSQQHFHSKHIFFFPQPSQPKFAWRTDIFSNRSIGCPWVV